MSSKQSVSDLRYECTDCGELIGPGSYRACCPDCDGELEPIPPALGLP